MEVSHRGKSDAGRYSAVEVLRGSNPHQHSPESAETLRGGVSERGSGSVRHNRARVRPCPRPSGSVRARPGCGEAAIRACTAGGREGTTARRARGEGSASTGGSEASARSAGARASASTGGCEASARSAGAGASASTGGIDTGARSAGAGASASTGGTEASARSAGARASASTGGSEASARSAGAGASASTGGCEASARSAGAGASASTGGIDTGARSAARLATRRLPRSAPPCSPSPRFWSSARTWRTRGKRTSKFSRPIHPHRVS